jgi:hypothetical protein
LRTAGSPRIEDVPWVNDDVAIGELELTRAAGDRRLYVLADVGIVRLKGWASEAASAEANGRSWETARRGLWRRPVKVTVDNPGVPGRLLFAAFVVRELAEDGSADAGAAASGA